MKTITQNIKIIILGLVVAGGVGYVSAAWNPAPSNPPANNVDAPINVGSNLQTKLGSLLLGGLGVGGDFTYLPTGVTSVTPGQVLIATNASGKVGWGNAEVGGGGGGNVSNYGYDTQCRSLPTGTQANLALRWYPACARINKTTGAVELKIYSGAIWTNHTVPSNLFAVGGNGPFSLYFGEPIYYQVGNAQGSIDGSIGICVTNSSGATKCANAEISPNGVDDWSSFTNPF